MDHRFRTMDHRPQTTDQRQTTTDDRRETLIMMTMTMMMKRLLFGGPPFQTKNQTRSGRLLHRFLATGCSFGMLDGCSINLSCCFLYLYQWILFWAVVLFVFENGCCIAGRCVVHPKCQITRVWGLANCQHTGARLSSIRGEREIC